LFLKVFYSLKYPLTNLGCYVTILIYMKYALLMLFLVMVIFLAVQPLPAGSQTDVGVNAGPVRVECVEAVTPCIDIDRLTEAIIEVESDGRSSCRGSKGERGLMQIRRATWKWVCRRLLKVKWDFNKDGFDSAKNRAVGRAYLLYLSEQLKSQDAVICAYNCGITNYLNNRVPQQTYEYLRRVKAIQRTIIVE